MASCPKCGFDLSQDGSCSVCGYGKAAQQKSETGAAGGPRPLPLFIAVAAACVVAAALVVVLRDGHRAAAVAAPAKSAVAEKTAPAAAPPLKPELPAAKAAAAAAPQAATRAAAANPAPAGAPSGTAVPSATYDPAKYEDNPYYRVPVGASPVAVRASKPIDLYDPVREPVYDIAGRTDLPPLTSEKAYVDWMLAHTKQSRHFLEWRWRRAQIIVGLHLITHRRVLMAFLLTPREWFVRSYNLDKTYSNTAIPIGFGQTISGPELVAHMTDALDPQPNQRVLEIGTGSGYQSAVLSELSNYVYTIEIVKPLAEQTNAIYLEHTKAEPQYANIHRRAADGYYGWPKYAPFDRIIVTTGIDHIPPVLLQELKPGGIMLIPIGPPTGQVVLKITKTVGKDGRIHLTRSNIYHTPGGHREIFVPFTAAGGGTHNIGPGADSGK